MDDQNVIVSPDLALSSATRATKGGRTIRYNLEILRQPTDPATSDSALEGMFISLESMMLADTNAFSAPSEFKFVHLSPVVELKIFELTAKGEVENTTDVANANYFYL